MERRTCQIKGVLGALYGFSRGKREREGEGRRRGRELRDRQADTQTPCSRLHLREKRY